MRYPPTEGVFKCSGTWGPDKKEYEVELEFHGAIDVEESKQVRGVCSLLGRTSRIRRPLTANQQTLVLCTLV